MTAARFSTLQDWLDWQESLHPSAIDLGLERVGRVAGRLSCLRPAPLVVTVAGTNGKGSSAALLESIYRRAGYRTGVYASPHLFRYNERIRIDARAAGDARICEAFARIDTVRGTDSLTYFEFGTLAALCIFADEELDIVILEVGLGGRLDAVNIVDADVALITSIGLDHMEWLGHDRDSIGREKAGIMRAGRPAVCTDSDPPQSVAESARACGARLLQLGEDFRIAGAARNWHWQGPASTLRDLPKPALAGAHQLANAAGVLMVVDVLQARLPVSREAVAAGLRWVALPGRVQRVPGRVEQVLDVSHNALAAQALVDALARIPVAGRTHLVLGMMADKDIPAFIAPLAKSADCWYAVSLPTGRAASAEALAALIARVAHDHPVRAFDAMSQAYATLRDVVKTGDRVLVCGSFYTVAEWERLNPEFN